MQRKAETCDRFGHVVKAPKPIGPLLAFGYALATIVFAVLSVMVLLTVSSELAAMAQAQDQQKALDSFMIAFCAFLFGGGALLAVWK